MIIEKLEMFKEKRDYTEFDVIIKNILNNADKYLEYIEDIISVFISMIYRYHSENPEYQNELEKDYIVIYSDDLKQLFDIYKKHSGAEEVFSSQKRIDIAISVIDIYSLSYKYEEMTQLLKEMVDSIYINNDVKKKLLKRLLAPDCLLHLTSDEVDKYIKINDTAPYGNVLNDELREFLRIYKNKS